MSGVFPFASSVRSKSGEKHDGQALTTAGCPFSRGASSNETPISAYSSGELTCPLGFGRCSSGNKASSMRFDQLPRMPLAVLQAHRNEVLLVSIKGVIFDVSNDRAFQADSGGGPLSRLPGHDASRILAKFTVTTTGGPNAPPTAQGTNSSPRGDDGLDSDGGEDLDAGLGGLRYDDHQRLESYFMRMVEGRRAVAVLADEDHVRIFGMPFGGAGAGFVRQAASTEAYAHSHGAQESTHATGKTTMADVASELHALVERGDVEAVERLLKTNDHASVINTPCLRTGMTPLLKAVESASRDVVPVLLDAGADVSFEAGLYDGDNALQLARRLGERDEIVEMLLPHCSVTR